MRHSAFIVLICAISAAAEGTQGFNAPSLAEQQSSLSGSRTGFRKSQNDEDTYSQGTDASQISLPTQGTALDAATRSKLRALKNNPHTTPQMLKSINNLLNNNPDGAHQRAAAAADLGYRQHGYANSNNPGLKNPKSGKGRIDPRRKRKSEARQKPKDGLRFESLRDATPIDLRSARQRASQTAAAGLSGHSAGPGAAAAAVQDSLRPLKLRQPAPRKVPATRRQPRRRQVQPSDTQTAPKPSVKDAWELIAAARRLLRSNKLPEAEKIARAAIALDNGNAMAHLILAQILLETGDFQAAVDAATVAVTLMPNNAEAYFIRALAYEQLGNEFLKLQNLEIAAAYDPPRFERFLKEDRYKDQIFDPAAGDSWDLFDSEPLQAQSAAPAPRGSFIKAFITFALVTTLGGLGVVLWRRRSVIGYDGNSVPWVPSLDINSPRLSEPLPESLEPDPEPAKPARHWKLRPGIRLAEKYKLIRPLSTDDAEIWRAQDTTLDRPAVVRRIFVGPDQSDQRLERQAAARKSATLHHPNVTDLFEILDLPSGLYVVYEYTPGLTVRQILDEKERLPIDQVRDILIPVCRALEHAHHRGVIHGGLSPERITVTKQGYIKVAQFATYFGSTDSPYFAPEVYDGHEAVAASDIYSLGVCCFEMLNGRLPEEGEKPGNQLLSSALNSDRRARLSSGRKFLSMLREEAASQREAQTGNDTDATA
jgi:tetratricopeptide (TPR) repeat protein